jgi:hypothetical protein
VVKDVASTVLVAAIIRDWTDASQRIRTGHDSGVQRDCDICQSEGRGWRCDVSATKGRGAWCIAVPLGMDQGICRIISDLGSVNVR